MDHSLDQQILPDAGRGESPRANAPMAATVDGGLAPVPTAFPAGSQRSRPAGGRGRIYWVLAVCGFLLLAVGLVFGQTVGHDFVDFDDQLYVYENPHVTPGLTLAGLRWALTDGPFGEWYPLTALSHMLDCQLYGIKPAGHYLTNVLLHAASSVLLFLVLLRMTGDLWPSAWVAAIFAIHPLHVESVAWVAERRDVLSGLFFMLVLGAYTLYTERPSLARYMLVAGLFRAGSDGQSQCSSRFRSSSCCSITGRSIDFGAAMAASSNVASGSWFARLPVGWRLVVEKIPLMVLAAVSCGIVLFTHSLLRSIKPVDRLPMVTRLANAVVSYATYVRESFYPVDLAPFYPHLGARLPMPWVVGSLLLLWRSPRSPCTVGAGGLIY